MREVTDREIAGRASGPDQSKPITPAQDRTLRGRGYQTRDLDRMPSWMASRHVGQRLDLTDAQAARGTYQRIADGTTPPNRRHHEHTPPPQAHTRRHELSRTRWARPGVPMARSAPACRR